MRLTNEQRKSRISDLLAIDIQLRHELFRILLAWQSNQLLDDFHREYMERNKDIRCNIKGA